VVKLNGHTRAGAVKFNGQTRAGPGARGHVEGRPVGGGPHPGPALQRAGALIGANAQRSQGQSVSLDAPALRIICFAGGGPDPGLALQGAGAAM
jgi:hypothetical protein